MANWLSPSTLARNIYYEMKPFLPRSLRYALRRSVAIRKRAASKDVWPINESAGVAPAGWSGWPEKKRFAFVLSHDVEGPEGVAKCKKLAELEMELGFRSSFNFIPEGTYAVTPELRTWLTDRGFEVGVHDLHHDGKLFRSRKSFAEQAVRINHYLKEWNAVGFRAGFMHNNLEWQHDIKAEYDASTFDTDPFEPLPKGRGTIFPFWVHDQSEKPRSSYVELPYSLPQDSTLFLIFRETSPEIWLRKLDWVASRGGMALVNVHPDYLRFEGESEQESPHTFPASYYAELLKHVAKNHAGTFWHTLPKSLASWFKSTFAN